MIAHFASRAGRALHKALLALACLACTLAPATAQAAGQSDEQKSVRDQVQKGKALELRDIEAIVLPKMRGMTYVSNRYYPVENVYILRFTDGPKVVDVEVDAETGKILWRSK